MTTRIEPIDWDADRHTQACRSAGLPTPWIEEHAAALAAQEAADKAVAGGQPAPAPEAGASSTPNLDKYLNRCLSRFGHHAARAANTADHQPDPESKNPSLDAWVHRCKQRFAKKAG